MGRGPKADAAGGSGSDAPLTQSDKFRDLARELECDEDEDAFKAKVKRIASATKPEESPKSGRGD
jgi:hypothetical protein